MSIHQNYTSQIQNFLNKHTAPFRLNDLDPINKFYIEKSGEFTIAVLRQSKKEKLSTYQLDNPQFSPNSHQLIIKDISWIIKLYTTSKKGPAYLQMLASELPGVQRFLGFFPTTNLSTRSEVGVANGNHKYLSVFDFSGYS